MAKCILFASLVGCSIGFTIQVYDADPTCTSTSYTPYSLGMGTCTRGTSGLWMTLLTCSVVSCDLGVFGRSDCSGGFALDLTRIPRGGQCVPVFSANQYAKVVTLPPATTQAFTPNLISFGRCADSTCDSASCTNTTIELTIGCLPLPGPNLYSMKVLSLGGADFSLEQFGSQDCTGVVDFTSLVPFKVQTCVVTASSGAIQSVQVWQPPPNPFDPGKVTGPEPSATDLACWTGTFFPEGGVVPIQAARNAGVRLCISYIEVCTDNLFPGCTPEKVAAGDFSAPIYTNGSIVDYNNLISNQTYYANVTGCSTDYCNVPPPDTTPTGPTASATDLACYEGLYDPPNSYPWMSGVPIVDARLCLSYRVKCSRLEPGCTPERVAAGTVIGPVMSGVSASAYAVAAYAASSANTIYLGLMACGDTSYCVFPPPNSSTPSGPTETATATATGTSSATGTATATFSSGFSSSATATATATSSVSTVSNSAPPADVLGRTEQAQRSADMGAGAGITILSLFVFVGLVYLFLAPSSPLRRAQYGSRSKYFSKWEVVGPAQGASVSGSLGLRSPTMTSSAEASSSSSASRVQQLQRVGV